jgi:hypothetical protein
MTQIMFNYCGSSILQLSNSNSFQSETYYRAVVRISSEGIVIVGMTQIMLNYGGSSILQLSNSKSSSLSLQTGRFSDDPM